MLLTNPFLFRKTVRLSVAKAGFALATPSVQVRRNYRLQASPAAMTVSGQSVTLRRALKLAVPVRTYAVAPVASRLLVGRRVSATVRSWGITGRSAVLFKSRVAGFVKTEFLVSGQSAQLRRNLKLSAMAATMTLSPRAVGMLKVAGQISVLPASVAIAGQAVLLRAARRLTLLNATYVVTGQQARMLRTYPLQANPAAFAIDGQSAILKMSRLLSVVKASYDFAQPSQTLTYAPLVRETPTLTWLTGTGSAADASSYSFDVSPANDGLLVIGVVARNGNTTTLPTTFTVDGGPPISFAATHNGGTGTCVGVGSIEVTAGTYTVEVNFSHGMLRCVSGAWLAQDYFVTTPSETAVFASTAPGGTIPMTASIERPSFSVAVVGGSQGSNVSSWSGGTQRYSVTLEGFLDGIADSVDTGSSPFSKTITANVPGTTGGRVGIMATF